MTFEPQKLTALNALHSFLLFMGVDKSPALNPHRLGPSPACSYWEEAKLYHDDGHLENGYLVILTVSDARGKQVTFIVLQIQFTVNIEHCFVTLSFLSSIPLDKQKDQQRQPHLKVDIEPLNV